MVSMVQAWVIRVLCSGPHGAELKVSTSDPLLVFASRPLQGSAQRGCQVFQRPAPKSVLSPHLIRSVLHRMISLLIS